MTSRPGCRRPQAGFTLIEVMLALTILLIGIAGLLSMHLAAMRATSFSRHASEASMLAQDKMELLRTSSLAALAAGSDRVDARGYPDAAALYLRTWTPTVSGEETAITVDVSWLETGGAPYTITMSSARNQ